MDPETYPNYAKEMAMVTKSERNGHNIQSDANSRASSRTDLGENNIPMREG